MTDTQQDVKSYKDLGCRNGWPGRYEDGNGNEVPRKEARVWNTREPIELVECKKQGHKIDGFSTMDGWHESWCHICRIKWSLDSGD